MVVGKYSLKSYQYHVDVPARHVLDCKRWCVQNWGMGPNQHWNVFGFQLFGFNNKDYALIAVMKFDGQYENYNGQR